MSNSSRFQPLTAALTVAACLTATISASALPIDFEDTVIVPPFGIAPSYVSHGFEFLPAPGGPFNGVGLLEDGSPCGPACAANGTKTLAIGGPNSNPSTIHPVTMFPLSAKPFTLHAFDYAEFVEGGNVANATRIDVIGHLSSGGSIAETVLIDGNNDGPGGNGDFQSIVLDAVWQSSLLNSVEFFGFDGSDVRGFQLDNLIVDEAVVPEPTTVTLVVLGLVFIGARRARQRAIRVDGASGDDSGISARV